MRKRRDTQPLPRLSRPPIGSEVRERKSFSVRIHYREQSYEKHRASGPRVYRWTFEVMATDRETAIESATAQFHQVQRESSVGWSREIEKIEVV